MKCPHKKHGRCKSCSNRDRAGKFEWSESAKEKRKGTGNPAWKGDDASYASMHQWVKSNYFNKNIECESCGSVSNLDLANISGEYLRKKSDWKILCRSCHMKFDYKLGMRVWRKHQMRCPNCNKNISDRVISKHFAAIGGRGCSDKKRKALKENIKKRWEKPKPFFDPVTTGRIDTGTILKKKTHKGG